MKSSTIKFRYWIKRYKGRKINKTSRELSKIFKIGHGSVLSALKYFKIEPKGFTIKRYCPKGHDTFKTGRYSAGNCKLCAQALQKKRRKKHKKELDAYSRKWHRENPKRVRDNYLKRRFGISLKEHEFLFSKQKGCCAICGIKQLKSPERLFAVDHDHKTRKVRGLLCGNCNRGLGCFKDNRKLLYRALGYLL